MPQFTLFVAMLLTATGPLWAQSDDWAAVRSLAAGRRIDLRIASETDQKVRGVFHLATPDHIVLVDESGVEHSYPRSDITRVRLRRSDVAPIAGVATGAGWGGLVAGISDGGGGQKAAAVATVTAIGWLIGKGIQKGNWKTIYEASP